MSGYTDYFAWLDHGRWIRVCARAIVFDRCKDRILLQRNVGKGKPYPTSSAAAWRCGADS